MAFTLWTLYEATLLVLNAVCILHEDRFLRKYGWGANQNVQGFGEPPSIKTQIMHLLRSIRTVVRNNKKAFQGDIHKTYLDEYQAKAVQKFK